MEEANADAHVPPSFKIQNSKFNNARRSRNGAEANTGRAVQAGGNATTPYLMFFSIRPGFPSSAGLVPSFILVASFFPSTGWSAGLPSAADCIFAGVK